ncbi:tannase/feruloyl esterase family alpha/beta hydrolase [Dyadobacter sp. CY323]|nr:tannase/feruloyl esterase family alpha/beta hydrolase [Dyadobacter sp. CY323]
MKALDLPEVNIHTATQINAGDDPDGKGPAKKAYCKLLGVIGREINFELILPADFNGRFAMSGGGGFVGVVSNSLRSLTDEGYANAGTDVGHTKHDPSIWAVDNMERQLNFGHLAIHRTAVVCKNLIARFYCSPPSYSYFVGASRGGGQAMMEAQRYPEDFDGIVAGAPAFNWTGFSAKLVQIAQKLYRDGKLGAQVLGKDHLALLQSRIMQQCDALDGVRDTILNDPNACRFDLASLPVCEGNAAGPACFTGAQIEVLRTIYEPLVANGKKIHAGFPLGGENEPGGWDPWIAASKPPTAAYPSLHSYFGIETFKYLIFNDKDWDYATYDLANLAKDTRYAAAYLNADSKDYSAFKKRGGKMLIWQGWADPVISALDIIEYYKEAEKVDPELNKYVRLYLMPGVLHGGGQGPDKVNWLRAVQDWVEKGIVPDRLTASKLVEGKTTMTRPVFPYPNKAIFDGKGDPMKEASFNPER